MELGSLTFMAIELALIPAIMIYMGRSYMKKPPKDMNSAFSYRTNRAQKNRETWEFAHRYIGRLWFWLGIVTAVITAVVVVLVMNKSPQIINMVVGSVVLVHLIPLIVSMVLTELALKKHFDEDGNRIS